MNEGFEIYIASIEEADVKMTEAEWREQIEAEKADLLNQDSETKMVDTDDIIKRLDEDGFVVEGYVIKRTGNGLVWWMDDNGGFGDRKIARVFESREHAEDMIDMEKADSKYDKWDTEYTFEIEEVRA